MKELNTRVLYPNPFAPSGIEFDLPEEAIVTLHLLDAKGAIISTVVDKQVYPKGIHYVHCYTPTGTQKLIFRLTATNDKGEIVETKEYA